MPTFDVFLGVQKTSRVVFIDPKTWGALKTDERIARKGIIKAPGIVTVEPGTSPSQQNWYPWNISSGISGYDELLTSTSGTIDETSVSVTLTFPPLDPETALEEYITQQNALEGTQVRNSTMGFQINTKHTSIGASRNISLFTRIYHRTSGGTETLLHTEETEIGLGFTEDVFHQFAFNVTLNTRFFEDERLVIKYGVKDNGEPA